MKKRANRLLCKVLSILLLLALVGCTSFTANDSPPSNRRNYSTDVCLSESAGPCIELFLQDYPDMKVTKVRWQALETGEETYVIEGNNGKSKSIVKYLIEGQIVLGRVEREFSEIELEKGKCKEVYLELSELLTMTELCDIASKELGGDLHEVLVQQKGKVATAYIESRYENFRVKGLLLNAHTGEILQQ